MLATTVGYQQMLAGKNITGPIARLNITLPGGATDVTATLKKATITKSTVSDMPDGTVFDVGYPSMELTFTLADKAQLFAPYNTGSAMFRKTALKCPVTFDVIYNVPGSFGVGEPLRNFTGQVDTYVCNPDGSVDFTCIDNRVLLRASVDLPAVVTVPPFNAGLTSEFALDRLLRNATNGAISSWPAIRAQCVFAAGFRSSATPEIGTLVTVPQASLTTLLDFMPGKFGTALGLLPDPVSGARVAQFTTASPAGNDIYAEAICTNLMTLLGVPITEAGLTLSSSPSSDSLQVFIGPTTMSVTTRDPGSAHTDSFTVTYTDAQSHEIAFWVHWPIGGTSWSATVEIDGTTTSSGTRTIPWSRTVSFSALAVFNASNGPGSVEALQITTEAIGTPSSWPFVPKAVLDPSLNTLQVIPAISGDTWQTIQAIADAELGVAGFDESGIFRFTNRQTIRTADPVRTVTSKTSLKSLGIQMSTASLVDQVTVPYTPWLFGTFGLAYTATAAQKIPAKAKNFPWTIATDGLVAQVDSTGSLLPNTHTTTDGNTWFRASLDPSGLNPASPGTVSLSASQPNPGQITITASNSNSRAVYLVVPSSYTDIDRGIPALWVGGQPVTPGSESTLSYPATAGSAPYTFPSNPWIQDSDTAHTLAVDLYCDMAIARPQLTSIDIVPDASLQMVDRIVLDDPDETGISEHATLRGSTLTLDAGAMSMTVDGRAVGAPGGWIGGVAGRSEGNQTTWGY